MTILQTFFEFWASSIDGIDHALTGQGGLECYEFLTVKERLIDTCAFIIFSALIVIPRVLRTLSLPSQQQGIVPKCAKKPSEGIVGTRRTLLITISLVFGAEMGFKIIKRTWIYVLNVCHVITIVQIYLLSAEPSRICTAVFRVHIHLLFAPFLAVLFPSTNSRTAPEILVFWMQHLLITFVVPTYLIHIGGTYTCEPLGDFSWAMFTVLVIGFYMYCIVQGIGMMTLANLNTVLCPAESDPFYGPYYRCFALVFTVLLTLLYGKIYCGMLHGIVELKNAFRKIKESPSNVSTDHDPVCECKGR